MNLHQPKNDLVAYAFGDILFASDGSGSVSGTLKIADRELIERIKSGKTGLSPGIKIQEFQCSICKSDYETCPHEEYKTYENVECHALMSKWEGIELSAVDTPADSRARVTDMLTIEIINKKKKFTWYGFKVNDGNSRFKNIQSAKDQKFITEKIGLFFNKFFLENLTGNIAYNKT